MTEINLLPWREAKREQEKKKFTTQLILAAVFALIVLFLLHYYARSLIEEQTLRNQRLQAEIAIFDTQIVETKNLKQVRKALISRMRIVQNLQASRTLTVHLFDELIKVLPDGVYLTDLKRTGNQIIVQGYSESNSNVSILMRNIESNPWIHSPVLTEIKKADDAHLKDHNEFNLSFILKPKPMMSKP